MAVTHLHGMAWRHWHGKWYSTEASEVMVHGRVCVCMIGPGHGVHEAEGGGALGVVQAALGHQLLPDHAQRLGRHVALVVMAQHVQHVLVAEEALGGGPPVLQEVPGVQHVPLDVGGDAWWPR
jgi:hypothetical protein